MNQDTKSHPSPLAAYATNVTSQAGEDGILFEIFRRIGTTNRSCVEFGAWDGEHLSNTYNLWHNHSWRALLIEADRTRCEELASRTKSNQTITVLNAFVRAEGEERLDELVRKSGFDPEPDLLSIDIDGDDFYIFQSLQTCRPRVVVVEYNPTIPTCVDLVQMPGEYFGASAAALNRLAGQKGYKLVYMTNTNCIFVKADEFDKLGVPELDLQQLFPGNRLTYVVSDYSGNCYVTGRPVYAGKVEEISLGGVIAAWLKSLLGKQAARVDSKPMVTPVRMFAEAGRHITAGQPGGNKD